MTITVLDSNNNDNMRKVELKSKMKPGLINFDINLSNNRKYDNQIDNKIAPFISCFPTSMANTAITAGITIPQKRFDNSKYTQLADIYNEFIYSDEMKLVIKRAKNPDINWGIKKGIELRELWVLEELAFNAFVGYQACKIDWSISRKKVIENIINNKPMVVGGNFCGYGHMVSLVGSKGSYIRDEVGNITKLNDDLIALFDDPYGNPVKKYKPIGVEGDNVEMPFNDLWNILRGDERKKNTKFAVVFNV